MNKNNMKNIKEFLKEYEAVQANIAELYLGKRLREGEDKKNLDRRE